ncbi:aminopeptidase, partial [Patescibacteria group bacterium]|nr:aminopeptidase [Patescibacteria group bacterium]
NMPGGSSYRPGDVLRSMSGKTIEIMNTDAEGRVILADAITYAKKFKPRLVVDVATLTGAAMVALGQRASAIMTKDRKLESLFIKLAEESGDYMWSLPLWEEYEEEVKGSRGDVTNTHNKSGRYGGAINGGIFLHEFARGLPWVHIDIAPRMESIPSDNLAPGAAGEPVRFLLKLIESY